MAGTIQIEIILIQEENLQRNVEGILQDHNKNPLKGEAVLNLERNIHVGISMRR